MASLFAEPALNSTALYYDEARREFACNNFETHAEGAEVALFGKVYVVTWAGLEAVEAARRASAPRFDAALLVKVGAAPQARRVA